MTEELNVVEKKECNCPVCKVLKSDLTKKFAVMTLASFVGCSLAIVAFGPKKPPMPKCPPPCMKMWDKQVPPPHFKKFDKHAPYHMYRNEMRIDKEFRGDNFKRKGFKHPEHKKDCPKHFDKEMKRPIPQPDVEK